MTGELRIWRNRRVRRRVRYMRGSRGFLSVNDGVNTMRQLSRAMRVRDMQRADLFGSFDPSTGELLPFGGVAAPRGLRELHDAPWTSFVGPWERRAASRRARWLSGDVPTSPRPDADWSPGPVVTVEQPAPTLF